MNQTHSLRSNNKAPWSWNWKSLDMDGGKGDLCRRGDLQRGRRLLEPSEQGGGFQRHNLKLQLLWMVLAPNNVAETWALCLSYFEPQSKMNLTLTKYCFKFLLNLILFCGSNYKDLMLNEKKLFLLIIFEKLFFLLRTIPDERWNR